VFTGLHEIDWASMTHAYGPATEVPDLLRGLASDDPREREAAADGMYGAVHHQGDVYDSTLACIPFLFELVTDGGVQDRGVIVGLLASIGGMDIGGDDFEGDKTDLPDAEEAEWRANYAMAHAAVRAGADIFLALLTDPDPDVRREVPPVLTAWPDHAARTFAVLRERLPAEPDFEARMAVVEAVSTLALRIPELSGTVGGWLAGLAAAHQDPALRLAALAQVARCAPGALPADIAAAVCALLAAMQPGPDPATEPEASPAAPSGLIGEPGQLGNLRESPAHAGSGAGVLWAGDLLRTLQSALGDRTGDRAAILADQLRSAHRDRRIDAVWMTGGLLRGWRGQYEELVELVGQQLSDPEPRLTAAAASVLEDLDTLAGPAADALARCLDDAPRSSEPGPRALPPWVRQWPDGRPTLGPAPKSLARLGDRRVLPALAWALEQPEPPRDIAHAIGALGEPGTSLVPLLRRRLREAPLDERLYDRCDPLLSAVAALAGYADAAAPAVPEVLRILRNAPAGHREWTLLTAARALGRIGPAALEAVPDLTVLLEDPSHCTAIAAASALWRIEPGTGADAVLPVLQRHIAGPVRSARAAVQAIAELGPAAVSARPRLRGLLTVSDPWLRLDAAVALWRVTGDCTAAVPVLRASWRENAHSRRDVARCAAQMGPAAAGLGPLLARELVAARRHNHAEGGYGGHDIAADLRLLEYCRDALSRLGGPGV
jgi:hypothetical protein